MSPKLITFLTTIVLFIFVGSTYGQVNNTNKGAAVIYTTGLPTGAVRLKYDSEVAINTTNGKFYRYDRTNSAWIEAGSSIGYLNSGAAPSGDPKYGGPELIINNDKELYWYYGGVWNCVNCAALGYTAGTGINITGTTITNTLPDQTVTLGSGTGILVSGSYPNFTITNDDPDQTVTITGAGISNITGTYPNFTITSTEVDGSITNEIQRIDSLYLSNDTLFISLLNDALPASAIKLTGIGSGSVTGGGIYGQSDTVSYQHLAVIDSGLTFSSTEDTAYFNIVTAPGAFGSAGYFNPDSIRLRHYDIGGSNELILNDDGVLLKTTAPDRVTIEGNDARYAADYRATYSDRSLIDKKYGDDFYLQEIDTFRVSNDTLYISLIRDSVPQSFVVLPAGSGSSVNLYELDIITPLPAVDVEGSMVLKTVDVNGSKILYVSNGTDWVEGGLFLDTLNVATINIGNDQVTYAKIQEVTAERLLGNPTGSTANPSEISLGSGLGFSGTTILNTGDLSTTNEIQQIDTFEIVSNILRASLGLDGVPFKSVDLSPYLDNTDSSGYNSAFTRSGDTLFITDGLSTKFVVLPSGIVDTDDQTLSLSNDTLYISQGNSVFLGQYLDNTDSQQLSIDSSIVEGVERFEISLDSSTSIYFDVPQVTDTDNQRIDTFSITNGVVSLSLQDDALPASTIDITESVQDITGTMVESNTETGIAVTYDDGIGKLNFVAVDQSITNEIQTLDTFEIVSDALIASMLNDGVPFKSVDLSPYLDNTDTSGYNISFTRSNDTLYLNDGDGQLFVKLPADQIGVDTSGSNYTFTRSNDTLFIADQNGILSVKLPTDNIGLDTSGYNLDFSRSNDTLFIRDGNGILSVKLPASVSTDTSGYNLDFRISDDSLYIRDGQDELFVNLDPYLDNTDTSGSNYTFTRSNDTLFIADQDGILSVKLPADNIGLDTSGYNLEFIRSNDTLYLRDGDGILSVKLPESVSTDTSGYNLQVRISGDTLYIRDGDGELFVDLADYLDNTDAQTLLIDSTDIGGTIERFGITISNGNKVYIDVPQVSGSGAGQNNVGVNIGSGIGIYAGKTDTILQFKSLVEGYGIDLSNTSTEITIRADTAQLATSHDVAVVQGDIDAHELADGDLDDTNELQSLTIDSVAITGKERFLLEISDGNTVAFDVDLNTDTQDISIDSAATTGGQNFTVTLQDGGDVDFFIPTNTDNQTLILDSAIVGSVERFELEVSNGNSVFFDIPQITDTDNQTLDTFEIVSNILRASLTDDGVPFKSVDLSPYLDNTDAQNLTIEGSGPTYDIAISGGTDITVQGAGIITLSETPANTLVITGTEVDGSVTNEIQDITVTGASQPFTLDLGSDATDATFTGAGITTVTRSGNDLTFTSTEVDGSITNELQTISVTGTTTATLDLSSDASDASITGAGINVVSVVGDAITITGTEIDGSISNEGSLTVAAGTGTTSIINSNTSGQTGVTITAAGINTISEVGNVITLTATEVDGSISNEGVLGVGAGSGTSSTLLSTTSTANAVTINAAGILAITESTSANGGSITLTATEVDGSITNEIQNLTYTAATGVVAIDGTGSTDATISVMTASTRGLVPDGDGSGTDEFLREDGTWAVPPSASTDLTIGGSGPTYTIESSTGTDVTIQASGITLSESPANTLIFTAVDGSITNEIQRLDTFEIVSNVLRASLLNDGLPFSSVSLSAYLDNTDNQTLDTFEIVSNILRASNFGDGVPFKSVDLSPYLDNTDTQDLSIDSTTIGSIERFTINLVGSPSISFDVSNTTGTVTSVAATQPAAGITISGSPITGSGTLTFALANDLAGLEGQSGTGIVVRTGDGTYAQRTATVFSSVASTANLAIGNANGVSGNPLISIETDHATNKLFVQAVSTTNLDLNGTETIDGISVTNGQRVLVAGQTAQEYNGIWDVVSAGAWTRSTDANTSGKIDPGILVNVKLGVTYGGTMWRLTTAGPYTLGSTDLVFEEVFKDEDPTNELQTIDTLSLSGTVMSLSLEGDGLPASTLDFASIIGSAADVVTLADSAALKAYTGAATGVLLKQAGRQGTFVRVPTTRAHDGFIVFTDGNGNKWQRIMDNVINVKWFGAKGDGVTDDTWAIQRAIDYSIYEDTLIKQVFIPTGNYVISKTIHLGYGNAYHSVSLIGDGAPTFRGEITSFNGTMLSPTFSNSPAINIQGARYTTVENITLVGLNDIDGFLSDTSASNINNWLDSGLDAIADNQRTPYAGITIDGFSGTAPSPAYAHYAYPSYAGDTTQYNKDFSSQVKISNCGIHGFVAGIVLQPNSDGNGDFTQVEKCIIDRVAYGISVGNANSRNFKILDCYIDAHTGITNSTHGNQTGRVTLIQNNHFGGYQWFALNNLPYLEGLEINNNYGESFYWLGSIGSVAGNQPTIVFNGCDFNMLATAQGTLQRFGDFIGSGAYVFNDCSFKNNRLYQFNNTNGAWIDFNQCKFNADVFEGEPGDTVETYHDIFFRNMLFVVGTYPERIKVNKSRFAEYAETNSLAFPQQDGNGVSFPTTLTYTSYWLNRSNEGVDVQYKDLGYPGGYLGIASAFDTYAFSGRTFTGKVKTNYKHGIGEGDALFIRDGDVFLPCMITEIDAGDTITALLMADYKYNTTTGAFENAFNSTALSAANVQHISSRKFLNTKTITGTFTAGSTTVTDVKYVYDGTDAATNFEERTPLLNMDGLLNAQTSPVSNDTWIDSVLTSSSILLSEAAIRNGTFPIQNCFTGNGGDKTAIPVQQIVYGNGNDIKSEAAFLYDSTNNRIILNGTSGERQITLNPKSGETTSSGGIRINSDGVADTDPVGRIEFVGNTTTGPYTQKGYIGFDISGSSAKGQALVFGLTTDGQSVLGTTTLYENQLVVNNSNTFTIANNTGRLEIGGSTGIYSRDKTWLLGGSAYTTANSNVRLKLAGDNYDTSTTKYGLQIYNGFNQSYFSARNDGNVILGGRTVASEFQILEASGSGTNYTGFKAQPMSADIMYTLPAAAGTAGQQLTWNSGDILTWESAGGSTTNIYNSDGDIKDGGTIVDVSGNDPIILALDNATTEQNRMLRLTFDHTDDVTNTYGISFVGPNDSLEIRSYDSGMYLDYEGSGGGEGFVISSNTILDLRGDSILISTPPTRTILHHLLGIYNPMAPQTVSQIEGTANGDILVWNETGGYWEIGTAGGGSNGIYGGSDEIPDGTIADLATDGVFTFDYSDGSDAIKFDDQTGYVRITDKSGSGQVQVSPGAINIQTSTQITAVVGSNTLDINEDQFRFSADTGTVRLTLFEPSGSGTNYTMFTQPAMSASQIYALPVDAPNDGEVLTWNTTGQLSWETAGGGSGDIINGGNTTGATVVIGTNDAQALSFKTNNVVRTTITGGASTGGVVTLSPVVSNTTTVADILIIDVTSSGSANDGFGAAIKIAGENDGGTLKDMARISTNWEGSLATEESSFLDFDVVTLGGSLTTAARVSGNSGGQITIGTSTPVTLSATSLVPTTNFGITSGNTLLITSSASSVSALRIGSSENTGSSTASISVGAISNYTQTSNTRNVMTFGTSFAPTSGTAVHNQLAFTSTINQTGGANGITRGILLGHTLTAVADFRAIEITSNTANAKAIYQTGANSTSNFVGGIAAGTTSAPDASAQIDIVSTTKGLGIPSMTDAQRDAITSPREGLVVYTTDQDALSLRDNGIWKRLPTTRTILKTADETVNNSSTYQADDALVFTAKANKKYVVKYFLYVEDVAFNGSNGAMKLKITAPSATTIRYGATGGAGLAAAYGDSGTDITVTDVFGSTPNEGHVIVTAYINPGASDRTVTLEWAQITADASDTKILEGSFLEYEEIN